MPISERRGTQQEADALGLIIAVGESEEVTLRVPGRIWDDYFDLLGYFDGVPSTWPTPVMVRIGRGRQYRCCDCSILVPQT